MDERKYEYDVAFSFLAQDEPIAVQLNDLLQSRLRTFVYSGRQDEVAGTDGEKTFNAVFGEQSRLVVVLYRNGWGQTPWSRIEETAIRNRAYEEGYDFVKVIPLDEKATVPRWLPKTQLWLGLNRWGMAGAASVIDARVQELGGQSREETVQGRAARLARSVRFSEIRQGFLHSDAGVAAANREFQVLCAGVNQSIAAINESGTSIRLESKNAPNQIVVLGLGPGLSITWRNRYSNTLDDSKLFAEVWKSHPPFPGIMHFEPPTQLSSQTFTFDLLPSNQRCWVSDDDRARNFDSTLLASHILKGYMDEAELQARK